MSAIRAGSTTTMVFPLLMSSDHVSPLTGATPTVTISKAGSNFAAPVGAVSEIGNGWYKLVPAASDTNTVGILLLHATATGADPSDAQYDVVAYDPADATALGLSRIDAAVSSRLAAGNVTVGDYATGKDPASYILSTPANKIVTNTAGAVNTIAAQHTLSTDSTLRRVGETIIKVFAIYGSGGTRVNPATFTVAALDPAGTNIASQIVPVTLSNGFYTYSFTPELEGVYTVSIFETTTSQYFDTHFYVGGSLADRLWNLANQGQNVVLGSGGGSFVFSGTVAIGLVPQPGVTVWAYQAQDTTGTDQGAVVDLQTVIATAVTAADGTFEVSLAQSYYALQYIVGNVSYQTYIRWNPATTLWVSSSSPIPAGSV